MSLIQKIQAKLKDKYTIGLLALLVFTVLYHLPYFNRFAPMTEGWFHTYSAAMSEGKVPYRDFYFFITPLYLYIYGAIISLFGGAFIVFRIYGIVERVFLNAVLYSILTKYFKPFTAAFACAAAFLIYSNHNIDIVYSYYQTSLFASLGAISMLAVCNPLDNSKKQLAMLCATGILAGISLLIKQTTGIFTLACIISYLFLYLFKPAPKRILGVLCAVLLPVFVICAWQCFIIYKDGAWDAFIAQIFTNGFQSKGSVYSILTNFYKLSFSFHKLLSFLLACAFWFILKANSNKPCAKISVGATILYGIIIMGLCVVLMASNLILVKLCLIQWIFYLSFFCGLYYAFTAFKRALSAKEGFFLLMSGASFAIMYSSGLSSVVDEWSCLAGGAFFIALMLDTPTFANRAKNLFIISFLSIMSVFLIIHRYKEPYEWWGDKESSITRATATVNAPAFKGLKMDPVLAERYTEIISLIHQNIKTDKDKIYISQNISGLYYASGTKPFTFAYTDYFDVCSDTCARTNAAAIKTEKPKVIIYMDFPEYTWQLHERFFRNNLPSGQREIKKVIEEISPDYQLIKTYNESKSFLDDFTLYIWVKKPSLGKA